MWQFLFKLYTDIVKQSTIIIVKSAFQRRDKKENTAEPKDELDPAARCKEVAKKMLLKREK